MISRTAEEDEYRSPWWLNRMLCWWDEWWWKEEIGARRTNLIPFSSVLEPSRACVPHRHRPEYQIKKQKRGHLNRDTACHRLPPTRIFFKEPVTFPYHCRWSKGILVQVIWAPTKTHLCGARCWLFQPTARRKIVYSNKVYTNPRNSPH